MAFFNWHDEIEKSYNPKKFSNPTEKAASAEAKIFPLLCLAAFLIPIIAGAVLEHRWSQYVEVIGDFQEYFPPDQ